MRDFRSRVVQRPPQPADLVALLENGDLGSALRVARRLGLQIEQAAIDAAAEKMFRRGQAGTLLALIGAVDVNLPFDTTTLLRRAFEARDFHTFLKQAHRLNVRHEMEVEIREAIAAVGRRAPREADAWRHKMGLA